MDTIRFEIERVETLTWGSIDSVIVFVNDQNLLHLAKENGRIAVEAVVPIPSDLGDRS